jgi:two-component system chemotaxis sensor kinase CheA
MSISEIVVDFLEDAKDQLGRFEGSLLKLDQEPEDKTALSTLFRAAHSLKGSSYYTGFQHLGKFIHKVENLLEPIAKGDGKLKKQAIDALFSVLDFVKQSLHKIQNEGEDLPVPPDLEAKLEKAFSEGELLQLDFMPADVKPIEGEDSDPELFTIYIDTLHEQLKLICEIVVSAEAMPKDEAIQAIERSFKRLVSSSRYMDYEILVKFFEGWQGTLVELIQKGSPSNELIEVSNQCVNYLAKILPPLNAQSLIEILMEEGGKPLEAARPFSDQELKIIDEELESAFARWMEDVSQTEVPGEGFEETVAEHELEETAVGHELLEEISEESASHEEFWEEIVEEEGEATFTAYQEELAPPDEIPAQPVEMLRVDPAKVDHLLNEVGELVIRRSHFVNLTAELKKITDEWAMAGILDAERRKVLTDLWQRYRDAVSSLGRVTADLQDAVMKIRMLPLMQLFQRFPRIVRDHASQYGKSVRMVIKGGETEVDRRILEQLYEPMIHILRNAVAHGIETPEIRRNLGKHEEGTITISAYYRGQHVIIEVTDDGAGVPIDRLKRVLVDKGFFKQDEVDRMDTEDLLDTIFLPGVSTALEVDETAGRGIGLDVVRDECRKINGHVFVRSWLGQGTQFVIQIPLTLAIIPGLLVKIKGDTYTLPLASVGEVYAFDERKIKKVHNAYFLTLEDRTVPIIFPDYLFPRKANTGGLVKGHYIVLLRTPAKEAGLVVDQFLGQQEVVIKPIEDVMDVIHGYAGATILGDGTVSLIIDVPAVIDYMEKLYK